MNMYEEIENNMRYKYKNGEEVEEKKLYDRSRFTNKERNWK